MESDKKTISRAPGKTTIAPGVIITIARLTALNVPGVIEMAPIPSAVNRLLRRTSSEGVSIKVDSGSVAVDLYLILDHGTYVRDVSRKVQSKVARAIEDMVGMQVERIDVHIEDIDFEKSDSIE